MDASVPAPGRAAGGGTAGRAAGGGTAEVLPRGRHRGRLGSRALPRRASLVAVLLAVVLGVAWWAAAASGLHGYDVRTPSMGTAAPVGSLVVTAPASPGHLVAGTVITFRAPGAPGTPYTHRIVAVDDDGIETRGDANGAADGWRVQSSDVIGRVVAVLPGVGWVVRGLPWVVALVGVLWFASAFVRSGEARTAIRLLGSALAVAAVAAVLRPFVAVQLAGTSTDGGHAVARLVSTGVLPVEAGVVGGGRAHLVSGAVAELAVPVRSDGLFRVHAALDLSPTAWVLLGAVCAVPVLVAVLVGRADRDAPEAG